jgi:hypothetical protein
MRSSLSSDLVGGWVQNEARISTGIRFSEFVKLDNM